MPENKISFLKKFKLFATLTVPELEIVSGLLKEANYEDGNIIFAENTAGDRLFLIETGVVEILKAIPTVQGIEKITLARLQPGEIFGELAFFDERTRSATAVAWFPTKVLVLLKTDFFNLINTNPVVGVKILSEILRQVASRLRDADEMLRDLNRRLLSC